MLQLLERIARQAGIDTGNDRDMRILKATTAPEKRIAQIDQTPHSASDRPGATGQPPG